MPRGQPLCPHDGHPFDSAIIAVSYIKVAYNERGKERGVPHLEVVAYRKDPQPTLVTQRNANEFLQQLLSERLPEACGTLSQYTKVVNSYNEKVHILSMAHHVDDVRVFHVRLLEEITLKKVKRACPSVSSIICQPHFGCQLTRQLPSVSGKLHANASGDIEIIIGRGCYFATPTERRIQSEFEMSWRLWSTYLPKS